MGDGEKTADLASSRGLPLMMFRLGYATFNSLTGLSTRYQWWGRLVETCIALKTVPDLRGLLKGLSTIDYITMAIANISRNPRGLGKKFNLNHARDNNLTLTEFFSLQTHLGFQFNIVPFADWLNKWKHDRQSPLYPLMPLFRDRMYGDQCMVELYRDTYRWDCQNVKAFLDGTGIEEPTFNREMLKRYLEQLIGVSAIA
jgi:thioester reductase-like protein